MQESLLIIFLKLILLYLKEGITMANYYFSEIGYNPRPFMVSGERNFQVKHIMSDPYQTSKRQPVLAYLKAYPSTLASIYKCCTVLTARRCNFISLFRNRFMKNEGRLETSGYFQKVLLCSHTSYNFIIYYPVNIKIYQLIEIGYIQFVVVVVKCKAFHVL